MHRTPTLPSFAHDGHAPLGAGRNLEEQDDAAPIREEDRKPAWVRAARIEVRCPYCDKWMAEYGFHAGEGKANEVAAVPEETTCPYCEKPVEIDGEVLTVLDAPADFVED